MAFSIPLLAQLRELAVLAAVFLYIFAAGRIADFLKTSGNEMKKKEVLLAPFAFMFVSMLGILLYFSSGAWVPPQQTIITEAAYLLAIPLAISIGLGALVLHGFFHGRLNPLQSLDLSMRIVLAPIFDGLSGFWTGIGAAAILVAISSISFWSSGGNFSLITLDFLLLSAAVAVYYAYKAVTAKTNEARASSAITALILVAPSFLRLFMASIVCALLSLIPIQFFKECPLLQAGNEVTLALSVLATLVILVPIIPVAYAVIVNALRIATAITILLKKETGKESKEKE